MLFPVRIWLALAAGLLLAGCVGGGGNGGGLGGGVHGLVQDAPVKLGKPYVVNGRTYVPTDSPTYDEIGEASWYGGAEQGRPTANGETFYRQRPSAAHKTLPLPSYVEVTRLDTGQRILVRVNDRGPYARDRILDLSLEAAKELDVDRAGKAIVRVRRVTPSANDRDRLRRGYPVMLSSVAPTATPPRVGRTAPALVPAPPPNAEYLPEIPAEAPVPRPVPTPTPTLMPISRLTERNILVASPSDPDAADALALALIGEGGHVVPAGTGYRVVTGPYEDEQARAAALARLRLRGYQGAIALDAPSANPKEATGNPLP